MSLDMRSNEPNENSNALVLSRIRGGLEVAVDNVFGRSQNELNLKSTIHRHYKQMVFLILLTRLHQSPPPLQLLLSHDQQLWPPIDRSAFFSINHTRMLRHRIHTKSRRWDSNAETFRTQNFDFNSTDEDDDDFEEEDDDDDDDTIQWLDILEDFIDGVWIFKVFRSFGWMLPAIISSLLLTSGPKAFLMALAIPLGQSVLSLVFQTVWGRPKNRTKSQGKKSKSKRRPPQPPPPQSAATSVDIDDEQEDKYMRGERKRAATGYQTWVAGDGGSSSNGSSSSFGGWEELDRRGGSKSNTDRRRKTSKSTLSRRERRSQTPLLLRLLIAVFPFLGSWTRLL
ncbi:uncharacterized protein LOC112529209 [Cynara cardunculus var. scolymus]|uniref:Uncharacterized protein n=1 Tax=Cynara cardunculus var. scolymus TaxID=59895 RepID=A0A124SH27_CYNCS|nr:uncharacterized protein LOC112529209 [Cynara cardunculus var. scolymus]KVI08207.1 hypothetical protein Ccrd_013424 [Cynara cardunculus var. scolymus]